MMNNKQGFKQISGTIIFRALSKTRNTKLKLEIHKPRENDQILIRYLTTERFLQK